MIVAASGGEACRGVEARVGRLALEHLQVELQRLLVVVGYIQLILAHEVVELVGPVVGEVDSPFQVFLFQLPIGCAILIVAAIVAPISVKPVKGEVVLISQRIVSYPPPISSRRAI